MSSRKSGAVAAPPDQRFELLPIAKIQPDPDNERVDVGDITELAASIKAHGLLEAVTVRSEGDGFRLVFGHRRLAAAKLAGLAVLPAIVRNDFDPKGRTIARLIENLHRQDLTPLEEAAGYKKLVDLELNQREIAEQVGRSQAHVSKRLALLQLPEVAKQAVVSGGITMEDAQELTKLAEHPERVEAAIKQRVSYGTVANAVRGQLTLLDQESKRAAALVELTAKGIAVVEPDKHHGGMPGTVTEVGVPWGVGLAVAKHSKLPCHAAFVDRAGRIQYVCTDLKSHLADESLKLPDHLRRTADAAANRRETIEKNRATRAAIERRRSHIRALLANPKKKETEAFMLRGLIAGASENQGRLQTAADLLGLGRVGSFNAGKAIQQYAGQGPDAAYRACLAIAFAQGESVIERGGWAYTAAEAIVLLDFLATTGFVEETQEAEVRKSAAEALKDRQESGDICSHCGEDIEDAYVGSYDVADDAVREAFDDSGFDGCFDCWAKEQAASSSADETELEPLPPADDTEKVGEAIGEPRTEVERLQAELDAEGPLRIPPINTTNGEAADRQPVDVGDFEDPEPCPNCKKLLNGTCRRCGRVAVLVEAPTPEPKPKPTKAAVA